MRLRGRSGSAIGEVFELDVGEAVAFLQLINRCEEYGDLIRVLPGTYREQPDLASLAGGDEAFLSFFPLEAARGRGIVRSVGRLPVPKKRRKFPTFRVSGGISGSGEVLNWWIWDGKGEKYVGQLTDEQLELPVADIVNDTALRDRVLSGWRHRDDAVRRSGAAASHAMEATGTTHFVYFRNRSAARVAAARFDAFGKVQLDESTSGARDQTLLRVLTTPKTDDAEQIRLLAEHLGGEYDGTETAVG